MTSSGKNEVLTFKPHIFMFQSSFLWLILCLFSSFHQPFFSKWSWIFLVFFLYDFSVIFLRIRTTEYMLTEDMLQVKSGIFKKHFSNIPFSRIESLSLEQGVLGRFLNFGNIVLTGVGGSRDYIRTLRNPQAFKEAVDDRLIHQAS